MKIGEIAGRAGVSVDTVRFYERVGVLPPPARTESGYRDYEPGTIERIRLARELQAIGFTLRDAVVLRISPPTPGPATRSRR
jgi:DNA-binding transcriptional MerR regulator